MYSKTPSSTLKPILLLLLAALTLSLAPSARAFDRRHSWDDATAILQTLHAQMDKVHAYRERFGAGPRLQGEIDQLRDGLAVLDEHVQSHRGDPKDVVTQEHDLWNLMTTVQAQLHARAQRESADFEVFHQEWRWQ